MKKLFFIATVFSLFACNQGKENSAENSATSPAPVESKVSVSQLATATDFVCGMTLTDDMIADTASYEGKLYGFCATECKTEFLKSPAQYLSQK